MKEEPKVTYCPPRYADGLPQNVTAKVKSDASATYWNGLEALRVVAVATDKDKK